MGREKDRFRQLLKLLPKGWEEKAKELGALQRAREIKTPEELLRLNLLYLTEGQSMATTSAITNLSGTATMSKVAVFKRIQNSGEWLKWICTHIYRNAGLLIEKPECTIGRRQRGFPRRHAAAFLYAALLHGFVYSFIPRVCDNRRRYRRKTE